MCRIDAQAECHARLSVPAAWFVPISQQMHQSQAQECRNLLCIHKKLPIGYNAALAFKVSKVVSTIKMSPPPPSMNNPTACSRDILTSLLPNTVLQAVGSALGPILPVWFVDPSGGVLRRDLVAGLARQPHTNKDQFVACASIVVAPPWQRSSTRVQLSWNHLPVFRGPC